MQDAVLQGTCDGLLLPSSSHTPATRRQPHQSSPPEPGPPHQRGTGAAPRQTSSAQKTTSKKRPRMAGSEGGAQKLSGRDPTGAVPRDAVPGNVPGGVPGDVAGARQDEGPPLTRRRLGTGQVLQSGSFDAAISGPLPDPSRQHGARHPNAGLSVAPRPKMDRPLAKAGLQDHRGGPGATPATMGCTGPAGSGVRVPGGRSSEDALGGLVGLEEGRGGQGLSCDALKGSGGGDEEAGLARRGDCMPTHDGSLRRGGHDDGPDGRGNGQFASGRADGVEAVGNGEKFASVPLVVQSANATAPASERVPDVDGTAQTIITCPLVVQVRLPGMNHVAV
jgi:hypothetical protein